MNSEKRTQKLLPAILMLQVLTLGSQWTGQGMISPATAAAIPDPGARQVQMVEELKQLNVKLDRLVGVLESGKLQVTVTNPDEEK